MRKVALIACVKEKRNVPSKAIELYDSDTFRSWLKHAETQAIDQVYILSGKYGLLKPEEVIKPYDLNLNDQSEKYRIDWYEKVINRLRQLENVETVHFLIYTNKLYYQGLIQEMKSFEVPIEID